MSNKAIDAVFAFIKKYIAPALPVLTVLGIVWLVFAYTVHSEIQSSIAGLSSDVSVLKNQVGGLEISVPKTNDRIDTLLKDALDRSFPKPSSVKADTTGSIDRGTALIKLARRENIRLNPDLVTNYGIELISIGGPRSWFAINEALAYYSSTIAFDSSGFIAFHVDNKDSECITATKASGWVIKDFMFEHCTQHLDDIFGPLPMSRQVFVEHTAFKDAHIIYTGGPLRLRNVYFVNCTFELRPNEGSQLLARAFFVDNRIPFISWQ